MTWESLAPRGLFFRGAPALIPWLDSAHVGNGWLWWVGVGLLTWFLVSILFAIAWSLWIADLLHIPKEDDDRRNDW